jgi:uncharacterized Zn finger protein
MAWYRDGYGFPPKLTVGERKAQARREAAALEKKGHKLQPIELTGPKIATTFWGGAWCDHLETYSDYVNRLERGRSYVRSGSVIDLKLEPGCVRALVSGSEVYSITIDVDPLPIARWKQLVKECSGEIGSLVSLLSGTLPAQVMERLCDPRTGIFPTSKQLALSCSCPDYAGLCKHLAAVLYGVGSRLDHEPELLFVLRGVEKLDLIDAAAAGVIAEKQGPAKDELRSDELADLFGIELVSEEPEAPKSNRKKPARRSKRGRKAR